MHQSKLIRILRKIPRIESKYITRFLQYTYPKNNITVVKLFKYLYKYHPKFESTKLAKESVFEKIFPDEAFKDKKMRMLQSDLVKPLEEYMVIEEIKKDKFLFQYILANALDRRNNSQYYKSVIKNLQKDLSDSNTPRSLFSYLALIIMNRKLLLHPATKQFHPSTRKVLDSTIANFYRFSVLANLQFMIEVFEREKDQESIYSLPFFKEAIEHAKDYASEDIIFEMYLALIDLVEKKDEQSYRKLKDLHAEYNNQVKHKVNNAEKTIFSQGLLQQGFYNEQRLVYIKLHNFIISKIYEDHVTYKAEQFELYKSGVENNLITNNNQIPDSTFINICISGAANKAFEWTENFITKYESYLDEACRPNAVALSRAFLHFHLKDFEKAFDFLNMVKEKDLPYNFRFRSLCVKCYYEFARKDDSYIQPLKDYIGNFKQFIKKSNLNKNRKLTYTNFCTFCKKLIGCKESNEGSTQETKHMLKEELDATRSIIAREWLVEKIEEL